MANNSICFIAVLVLFVIPISDASASSWWRSGFSKYADGSPVPEKDVTNENISLSGTSNLKPCDENKLMLRLANLQVISPERIVLLLTTESFNEMCRSLSSNIDEVHTELKHCVPLEADNIYGLLFQGISVMFSKLCNAPTDLSKKLTVHYACLKGLREELIDCEGPADWFEKTNHQSVCQIFEDILNCQYVKAAELCGLEPAQVLRSISTDVLNGSLITKCDSKTPPPEVKNPMPIALVETNSANASRPLFQFFSAICPLLLSYIFAKNLIKTELIN